MKLANATVLTELCRLRGFGGHGRRAAVSQAHVIAGLPDAASYPDASICGYDSRFMHPELQEAIDLHEAIVAEAGNALVGYDTEKALANVVLLSEIPTTYDKDQKRQVNAGNLLLRGVPGVGKTFFGVILAAISNAKFARIQGRADLQPTEIVGFQMINPATGEFITEFGPLASAEVILLDEINRIPLKSQSAFLEGPAGPHRDRRQDHLRDGAVQLRDRDDEPGGARAGHVSAVRSGDRSLRDHRQHRLPAAGRGGEARQLRLQAGAPEAADAEGADHRAARARSRAKCFCTSRSPSTSAAWSAPRAPTTPKANGCSARRRSWSRSASISAPRPARRSAWGRLVKVWALLMHQRAEVYPEDVQELARYILSHRVWLGPHAASHGVTVEMVIDDIVDRVPVP